MTADLNDTPYTFVRRELGAIVLQYGRHTTERWRWVPARRRRAPSAAGAYLIRYRRRVYRFAGVLPQAWAVTHRAQVADLARASRARS